MMAGVDMGGVFSGQAAQGSHGAPQGAWDHGELLRQGLGVASPSPCVDGDLDLSLLLDEPIGLYDSGLAGEAQVRPFTASNA